MPEQDELPNNDARVSLNDYILERDGSEDADAFSEAGPGEPA
jgi:hypothetical protein